ncbi:MAG: gamma-glutamyl-gamma-aminobutyrate hydrolase family protein [Lachnospiraceae bacterium]|nr:gamma-glutamyl-gamma-aminobutyrate hydrolase family protein [Lachnospiraceae bacterium]
MKRILIAGEPDKTANYEKAMQSLGVMSETSLHVPDVSLYSGLILPGGGDIDPRLFGQIPKGSRFFDPELDRLQLAVLKAFILDRKPVLGICKGMQLINIYFGGDMFQHLETSKSHEYLGKDQVHGTTAEKDSFLEKLYGSSFPVNSAHHQGVDVPGQGIRYVQRAEDGVVEGLSHTYLLVMGVQWHPERLCFEHKREDAVDGSLLLRHFVGLSS